MLTTKILEERAELHTLNELLPERPDLANEFQYLTEEWERNEPRILRLPYGNAMLYFDALDTTYADDPEWDAYIDDTFFSRFVLKWLDDEDGFVRVGFQMT